MVSINTTQSTVNNVELKKELGKAQELKKMYQGRTLLPVTTDKHLLILKTEKDEDKKKKEEYVRKGLEMLKQGKVAVVTMAGGQGTRLGTSAPKGCYTIKGKSLFAMQKERLQRLSEKIGGRSIPWLIMTSEATHQATVDYFGRELKDYSEVTFFKQTSVPALDKQGEVIKTDKQGTAFMAPSGNGDIFGALRKSGELEKLKAKGVEFVHVQTVDNVLSKPADPALIGAACLNDADVLSKSILRKNSEEKIGVFAISSSKKEVDKLVVAEYTELPKDNEAFVQANIASHLFTLSFLEEMAEKELPFHLAEKKIPSVEGGMVEGYKLEKFIFDALPFARKPMVLQVERGEFSPLKNATGADSPQTCADDLEKVKPKDDLEKVFYNSK